MICDVEDWEYPRKVGFQSIYTRDAFFFHPPFSGIGDEAQARNLLEICAGNLEMAINMHMESTSSAASTSANGCVRFS